MARELLDPARPRALHRLTLALTVRGAVDVVLGLVLAHAYIQGGGVVEDMSTGSIRRDPAVIGSGPGTLGLWVLAVLAVLATSAVMVPWI